MRFRQIVAIGCLIVSAWSWFTRGATAQYVSTGTRCLNCHVVMPKPNDFCSVVPAEVWARDDKHSKAFELLYKDATDPAKDAAKRELVTRILGFDLREAFANQSFQQLKDASDPVAADRIAKVKLCLRCHATWPLEADENFPQSPPVELELGVSCQACHGPGRKWDQPHSEAAWRVVTPAGKAKLGFTDCRSPAAKVQLCASCHVGNLAQGKFVKHEWYAAGHPPLPSFELASFEAQMPVHWKSLREKGPFRFRDETPPDAGRSLANLAQDLKQAEANVDAIKASYCEANFPGAADPFGDLPRMKDTTVAGAAVLEAYVRLVGDYAAAATSAQAENKAAWPELALYDCTACHHELRSGLGLSSRPKRSNSPGRPPLMAWPTALAQLAAQQAAGYDAAQAEARWSLVRGQLRQLELATTGRPFGDPAAMHAAAETLAATLASLATDAANSRYDAAAARQSLQFLTNPDHFELNDFATARQVAWSIREIAADLGARDAKRWFLRGGDDPLALTLPSGPGRSVIENLGRWLPAAAQYDPALFREQLQSVRAELPSLK